MLNENKGFLKTYFVHCFFVSFLFLFIACSNSGTVEQFSDNEVVAVINGNDITVDELKDEIQVLIKQFRIKNKKDITPEEKIVLKTEGLNRAIRNNLLIVEAASNHVSLSMEEYDKALNNIKSGYQGDFFVRLAEVEGVSPRIWKKSFKNNLLIKKFIRKKFSSKTSVNERQIREYYDGHQDEFKKGQQVRSLHIMVASEGKANAVNKEIRSKKQDFSDLAKAYSLGPEGPLGGDLGYFEVGQMPEEFDGVFKLKINQVSDIIKTPYGYHLFKVVDKRPARLMSFDESKKIIYNQLLRDEQSGTYEKWLVELKDTSDIKIKYDVLSKINL